MSVKSDRPALVPIRGEAAAVDTYLSTVSPKDDNWDRLKVQSKLLAHKFSQINRRSYTDRMVACSQYLHFNQVLEPETGAVKLKLFNARFCRVRLCPICQWRKSLMWIGRFMKALPRIREDYPNSEFIYLVLTVKNMPVEELRDSLDWMNRSWQRLIQRKAWPGLGFVRATEITRSKTNEAHPHFNALMMVPKSYFQGKYYLSTEKWIQLWQESLQVEYQPSVWVQKVKPKQKGQTVESALIETFKYPLKYEDMAANNEWLDVVTGQINSTKAVSLGGCFKKYMKEDDPENLIGLDEEDDPVIGTLAFGWRERFRRYTVESM